MFVMQMQRVLCETGTGLSYTFSHKLQDSSELNTVTGDAVFAALH
jgi:hypothetical protein